MWIRGQVSGGGGDFLWPELIQIISSLAVSFPFISILNFLKCVRDKVILGAGSDWWGRSLETSPPGL